MKNAQFLATAQQLSLTPQVQQAIRLLQMSSQELDQELSHLLQVNPFLELQEPEVELHSLDQPDPLANDQEDDSQGRDAWGDTYAARAVAADVTQIIEQRQHAVSPSLHQHLLTQMVDLHLPPVMRWLLEFVIQSVDDDGFLTSDVDDLLQDVQLALSRAGLDRSDEELQDLFTQTVAHLRSMEPAGVGATDWRHSVQLQIQRQMQKMQLVQNASTQEMARSLAVDRGWAVTAQVSEATLTEANLQIACAQRALLLLEQDTKALARKDVRFLALVTGLSMDDVRQALQYLKAFVAYPGRAFGADDHAIVVPDLLVVRKAGDWAVEVNPRLQRQLHLYDPCVQGWGDYVRHNARQKRKHKMDAGLRGGGDDEQVDLAKIADAESVSPSAAVGDASSDSPALEPMHQHLQDAKAVVKALAQRYSTLQRVGQVIVQRQRAYMQHGVQALRPMTLKDVADELGLHESTVSRATAQKYMQTPHGVQELKFFFSSPLISHMTFGLQSVHASQRTEATTTLALVSNHGGAISSEAVRSLIAAWIADENPKKPISDQRISDRLKQQGVDCARRTVAKYREALQIAPTHLRKTL